MTTWRELARDTMVGDRVVFTEIWDRYPDVFVPVGSTAIVVENDLSTAEPTLYVRPDDEKVREHLKEWDGLVHVYGPGFYGPDESWDDEAPLKTVSRKAQDAMTIASAFRKIYTAAMVINQVLLDNEDLNNSVPTNWPLNMSADEFAAECNAMAEHYEALAHD